MADDTVESWEREEGHAHPKPNVGQVLGKDQYKMKEKKRPRTVGPTCYCNRDVTAKRLQQHVGPNRNLLKNGKVSDLQAQKASLRDAFQACGIGSSVCSTAWIQQS